MLKGVEGVMDICRETAPVLPGFTCLYAPEGGCVSIGGKRYELSAADSLVIFTESREEAMITGPILRCHVML
jgi:hypothetical protein